MSNGATDPIGTKPLTHEEHTERHRFLHRCLDELIADWIGHTRRLPSKATVRALMQWSYEQTLDATEIKE